MREIVGAVFHLLFLPVRRRGDAPLGVPTDTAAPYPFFCLGERMTLRTMGFTQIHGGKTYTTGHVLIGRDRVQTLWLYTPVDAAEMVCVFFWGNRAPKRDKREAVGTIYPPPPLQASIALLGFAGSPEPMPMWLSMTAETHLTEFDLTQKSEPFTASDCPRDKRRESGGCGMLDGIHSASFASKWGVLHGC